MIIKEQIKGLSFMFNLIIGLNHAGSQIISQGSETRNLWNNDTKRKISISFCTVLPIKRFFVKVNDPLHDFAG